MTNCYALQNFAREKGSVAYLLEITSAMFVNVQFISNFITNETSSDGYATVIALQSTDIVFKNCLFFNNSAIAGTPNIYSLSSDINIFDTKFTTNKAGAYYTNYTGGYLKIVSDSKVYI